MITSPQTIQVRRDGVGHNATISWRMADRLWAVATSLRPSKRERRSRRRDQVTRPSQDQCGMSSPSGTSSAEEWWRSIVVQVAHAK